jgi:hypothetical protein
MSQVNYAQMSDEELRRHFIQHREDKTAFRAYLDRIGERPHELITTVDDPDFDTKIQAAVERKAQSIATNGDVVV